MEIIPLAAESMGTRSMATFIETDDLRILFDPGVSLLPDKKGLAPHALESWRFNQHLDRIRLFAGKADVVVISHFHPSHVWLHDFSLYKNKSVYIKNPNQQIEPESRRIAFNLMQNLKGVAREISFADGRVMRKGETELVFSPPISHGEGKGAVVQLCVRRRSESFLISSDIHLPSETTYFFVHQQQPNFLYLDGLPTGLPGFSRQRFFQGLEQIKKVFEIEKLKLTILDHHLLRAADWEESYAHIAKAGELSGVVVQTAAELRGEENDTFEARRAELFANDKDLH